MLSTSSFVNSTWSISTCVDWQSRSRIRNQWRAVDIARWRARQKHDDVRYFLGSCCSFERNRGLNHVWELRDTFKTCLKHWCIHPSGAYDIYSNMMLHVIERCFELLAYRLESNRYIAWNHRQLSPILSTQLWRGIRHHAGSSNKGSKWAQIDDRASPKTIVDRDDFRRWAGSCMLIALNIARTHNIVPLTFMSMVLSKTSRSRSEVGAYEMLPSWGSIIQFCIVDGIETYPDAVDAVIDSAKLFLRYVHHSLHAEFIRHVYFNSDRAIFGMFGNFFAFLCDVFDVLFIDIRDDNADSASFGKCICSLLANSSSSL